jgi:hypothetical protein
MTVKRWPTALLTGKGCRELERYMRKISGMHEKNLLTARYSQGYIGPIFFKPLI